MRRPFPSRLVGLGLLLVLAGCGGPTPGGLPIPLDAAIVVREGLPRTDEDDLPPNPTDPAHPRATVDIEGYTLYQAPLTVNEADRRTLATLLNSQLTYWAPSGSKKCGGFHPDFAVEWSSGGQPWRLLICFSCSEVEQVGPDGIRRFDLNPRNRERLQTLLDAQRLRASSSTPPTSPVKGSSGPG